MKTILVPTDFSPAAENAAKYAVELARYTKSGVKLLNAIKVPTETHMAAQVTWPLEGYPTLKRDADQELKILANRLLFRNEERKDTVFQPQISYSCLAGNVADTVKRVAKDHDINLVVMGLWDTSKINRFLAGSTSHEMIEKAELPLLLIPPHAKFKPIKTIAFATDFSMGDINIICSLATLARAFNAEILLLHVFQEDDQHSVSDFLSTVTNQANYPNIYYRGIVAGDIDTGLNLLLEQRELEMFVMIHRRHNLLDRLFNHSHVQRMARYSSLPLLIFPAVNKAIVL
ncbi:hypothetical protein BEL04_06165 [Mucilaginibacter sp. PPCGB 2223]|uniref:universal stress protein n=1 Tax=Mucilaginibacter sp. PPCGB 2223 TaxID=1886027 RepID=UPI0008244781|nr:universal stress protein [Mucilaginibacter sp. PPCGB 2223]OCX53868.1 hypothetical protein BEL04_06165 [Mucilaginibacter sp. PPCGB 2223]